MSVFTYFIRVTKNRKLTIPELKRLMYLPEDFKLENKFDKHNRRIDREVFIPFNDEESNVKYIRKSVKKNKVRTLYIKKTSKINAK